MWVRLRAYDPVTLASPGTMTTTASGTATAEGALSPREADMTIAPLTEGGATASSSTSASEPGRAMSAREQRYNELLRSAPPSDAAAQGAAPGSPDEPPSLIERVVAPIAEALGRDKPKQVASAPPAPRSQPQQPQQQQPQPQKPNDGSGGGSSDDGGNGTPQQTETDPDADNIPPRLLGADFNPPQVQDGDVTMLAVLATDNMAGIRSVSGVIASPTGAVQGFACQREGESNRYVARITVPKDAAEGVWEVRYLTLTDLASNSVSVTKASGGLPPTASFRVASQRPDSAGPVLRAVWLDRPSMNAGERNTLFVQAEDESSGINTITGVFVSPSKQARVGFNCRPGGSGAWECPVSPPSCVDCGAWQLEQVQMQDKANNTSSLRVDNPLLATIQLNISGDRCDGTAPTLTALSLDPPVVSNADSSIIRITATVNDDSCGATSLSGQAQGPGGPTGPRLYFSFEPSPDGQNFNGKITVPKHAATGVWTIAWIQVLDKGHNLKAYPATDPIVSRVTFRVE